MLVIDGMFCAGCAASVEASLRKQPGVRDAAVNFAADAAVLDWDGREPAALIRAVTSLGYDAHFVGELTDTAKSSKDPARQFMLRLVVAIFFGMWTMLPSIALYLGIIEDSAARPLAIAAGLLSLPVVAWSGLPFYRMGIATLKTGVAGIDALVFLGVVGALLLSTWNLFRGSAEVYFEVPVALISLQLVARLLDLRVRRRARDAVVGLLELAPSTLTVLDDTGQERDIALRDAEAGMRVLVRPGARIAVDGKVVDGHADIDRSVLSGESLPARVGPGDVVSAGERVLDAALVVEVVAASGKRRIDGLARQVRQSLAAKPAWQRVADRVARWFVWGSLAAAGLAAIFVYAAGADAGAAAVRALAVFVIACPCALSLAAPLAGLSASAVAAKRGMVIRDMNAATSAARPSVLFLDKTGTLTIGRPQVVDVHAFGDAATKDVLTYAAAAEKGSEHPLAGGILRAAAADALPKGTSRIIAGRGVEWRSDEHVVRVGRPDWFEAQLPEALPPVRGTRVAVELDGRLLGAIDLDDQLRDGIAAGIDALRALGVRTEILSGDAAAAVMPVADALGIEGRAGLSPEEKLEIVAAARAAGEVVAFAGDGINDGPALAAADLGIAVDGATDAARTAAAVSFVDAGVVDIPDLLRLTRRTRRIIYQNLVWATLYNAVAIPAAMLGWVHPAIAAAAMALSSITIVANASRARLPAPWRIRAC